MHSRGRRGLYDLVFGGEDRSGRVRVDVRPRTVCVGVSEDWRVAAVLTSCGTATSTASSLTFYGVDGEVRKTVALPDLFSQRHAWLDARVWVGQRVEAIIVVSLEVAVAAHAHAGRPLTSTTYHVAADGRITAIYRETGNTNSLRCVSDAAFTRTPGFALLRQQGPEPAEAPRSRWRLTRFADPGEISWQRDIVDGSPWLRVPATGPDLILRFSSAKARCDFRPDGTFSIKELIFDPVAFDRANPGYRERVGQFYEREYLPMISNELSAAVPLTDDEKVSAHEILRGFVYGFGDSFVSGGNKAVEQDRAALVVEVDHRFRAVLSADDFSAYRTWRRGIPKRANFLRMALSDTPRRQVDLKTLVLPVPPSDN